MDPGIGLIVNSIVPSEPGIPKLPPKSKLKLPDGFLEKPHVRHALKYMASDEQREKALEVALAWKKRFAADKWKPVVAAIDTARREDSVRSFTDAADLPQHHEMVRPAERPRAVTAPSAPVLPVVPRPVPWPGSKRIGFTRQSSATASLPLRRNPAPMTPRSYRWDAITSGPVTPLSPMPVGNAFASSASFNMSSPQGEQNQFPTPMTAMFSDSQTPLLPQDTEARTVYKKVKGDIDAIARKYCLARFNMNTSRDCDDFVPATMIKPKDVMEAAQVVLHSKRLKLEEVIIRDLPDRLKRYAAEETKLRGLLCIKDELELAEQNDWMNNEALMPIPEVHKNEDYVPPPFHLAVSILDEQREALRMFYKQRDSGDLELYPMAIEAAWAVQILEEAERLMAADADGSSNGGDDDEGYSYPNFLRSIKSEMSARTSTSSGALALMVEELSNSDLTSLRSRANTNQTVGSMRGREFRSPQRSSTSPTNRTSWSTRLSGSTATSNSRERNVSLYRRPDLSVATETIDEVPSSELSPEDREFRHRGPNRADLDYWAEELKKMEAMRAERQRSPTIHRRPPQRDNKLSSSTNQSALTKQKFLDDTATLHSRFSSSSSSGNSNVLEPLPRLPNADYAPSIVSSLAKKDGRPSMLDHEYHQRNLSKSSSKTHRRDNSKTSMHDSLRRHQHLRSASSVSVLAKSTPKAEQDEWTGELKRMESRERVRQAEERRRASQPWEANH